MGYQYDASGWRFLHAAPSISFVVNGTDTIGTSGHIPYDRQWHKVGGNLLLLHHTVDLKVINSTFVASGNDLGLDDISFNVCAIKNFSRRACRGY